MKIIFWFAVLTVLTLIAIVILIGPRAVRVGMISGGFSAQRLFAVGVGYLAAVAVITVLFVRFQR
jgi:hypothetical protein